MEDLEEVRARMRAKKQPQVLTQKNFDAFYRFAISTMSCMVLVLIVGCFFKGHEDLSIYDFVDQHILSILPSFHQEEREVSLFTYEQMDNGMYVGSDPNIYALKDGVVKGVEDGKMTILYQNNVIATYASLATIEVAVYDRISQGEILATYEECFEMTLMKDGNEINEEEMYR